MPRFVVSGARLKCSEGMAPSSLVVSQPVMNAGNKPLATVEDHLPLVDLMPFGLCRTLANPQVAAATSAAGGVLTPQPCIPVTADPWTPGAPMATVLGKAALTDDSTCRCQWSGIIEVTSPGTDVQVSSG